MKSAVVVWGNFLRHEKLDPSNAGDKDVEILVRLVSGLAEQHPEPKPFRAYADRIACRKAVCKTAIELGIDLTAIRHKYRGKVLMGRGLLDVWTAVYAETFGSNVGTQGRHESKRRNVKTNMHKEAK